MDAAVVGLLALPLAGLAVLWRAGALADPHRRAWRAIAGTRATAARSSSAPRARALAWLAARLDLALQLRLAGRRQTPSRFLLQAALYGGGVLAAVLLADGLLLSTSYTAPVPPWWGAAVGIGLAATKLAELPRLVRRRRRAIDEAMTELMVPLTIVSTSGAIANRREAIALFAKALDDPTLERLVLIPEAFGEARDELAVDYRALVPDSGMIDDVTLFGRIGETYGSELFRALGQAEHQVKRQRPVREALRGVADQFQARQIAEDEEWVDMARTRVNVPMSAFVLLVFVAILVPTVTIILQAIGG